MISVPIAVKNVSWQASRKTVDPAVVMAPASKNLGFGDLATSACIANLDCYEGDDLAAMEALPRDGTNDQFVDDDGSYSYSYSYDVGDACDD